MITLYGIPNCTTVKKARAWLAQQGVAYQFHDFKKAGVPAASLAAWMDAVGGERLLNRQGTTWRKLAPEQQALAHDAAGAAALMQAHPSLIKRPVVQWRGTAVSVGFDAVDWAQRLG